jgi:hypothetical protein
MIFKRKTIRQLLDEILPLCDQRWCLATSTKLKICHKILKILDMYEEDIERDPSLEAEYQELYAKDIHIIVAKLKEF